MNEPPLHQRKPSQHKLYPEGTSTLYRVALMLEIVGNYCEIPWEDGALRRNPDLITEKLKSKDRAANFDRSAS